MGIFKKKTGKKLGSTRTTSVATKELIEVMICTPHNPNIPPAECNAILDSIPKIKAAPMGYRVRCFGGTVPNRSDKRGMAMFAIAMVRINASNRMNEDITYCWSGDKFVIMIFKK